MGELSKKLFSNFQSIYLDNDNKYRSKLIDFSAIVDGIISKRQTKYQKKLLKHITEIFIIFAY